MVSDYRWLTLCAEGFALSAFFISISSCSCLVENIKTLNISACQLSCVHPVSVSLLQGVRAALAYIWEEQKFTDVDFLVDGQVISAHKAVLASQSQYFECMLFGSMREASMNSVELKDVPVSAFRKVLQFAYTGSLDMENVPFQVYPVYSISVTI